MTKTQKIKKIKQTKQAANALIGQYGLDAQGWRFSFNNSGRHLGLCKYFNKMIQLSKKWVINLKEDEIKDTILHEIAHAIVGPFKGHGKEWKQVCVQIGARPTAKFKPKKEQIPYAWKSVCPECGTWVGHFRKPRVGRHCRKCIVDCDVVKN